MSSSRWYRAAIILLSFFLPLTIAAQQNAPASAQAYPEDARELPGMPGYRFAWGLNDQSFITHLLVYHNGHKVQALDLCRGNEPIQPSGDIGALTTADFNFDNSPDAAMLVSEQGEKKFYCVWLFNPQTQQFVPSEQLSQIPNPAPDPQTKTVVSTVQQDCAGGCFEQNVYAWASGRLKPVSSIQQTLDLAVPPTVDCRFVRIVKQERNGRLVETSRNTVDTAGNPCYLPQR